MASSSYDTCSKNDSKLQSLYYTNGLSSLLYFNTSSVFSTSSIPGITGNVFKGTIFRDLSYKGCKIFYNFLCWPYFVHQIMFENYDLNHDEFSFLHLNINYSYFLIYFYLITVLMLSFYMIVIAFCFFSR